MYWTPAISEFMSPETGGNVGEQSLVTETVETSRGQKSVKTVKPGKKTKQPKGMSGSGFEHKSSPGKLAIKKSHSKIQFLDS